MSVTRQHARSHSGGLSTVVAAQDPRESLVWTASLGNRRNCVAVDNTGALYLAAVIYDGVEVRARVRAFELACTHARVCVVNN